MYTLGVTSPVSTNNAAVLLEDGEVRAAVEEERFTGTKHSPFQAPVNAVDYCLAHEGISLGDVEGIGVGWGVSPDRSYEPGLNRTHHRIHRELMPRFLDALEERDEGVGERIRYVDHQRAHAASAYYPSGFDRANVLCLDGNGERYAGLLGVADGDVEVLRHVETGASLGHFYEEVTSYLGFRRHRDEGKVMGLASYGEPRWDLPIDAPSRPELGVADALSLYRLPVDVEVLQDVYSKFLWVETPLLMRKYPATPALVRLVSRLLPSGANRWVFERLAEDAMFTGNGTALVRTHRDLAASAQRALERRVLDLVEELHERTGETRFCFAGGVALNCVLNRRLLDSEHVDELFVQPVSHDAGVALGAALELAHEAGCPPPADLDNLYLGPEYGEDRIRRAIEDRDLPYERPGDVSSYAAEALAEDRILGWFQGRMEFGPRALGARSILGNPADVETKDRINRQVKGREPWRPFAPALREERAGDLFRNARPSPFMILSFDLKPGVYDRIPAAAHVDETARPQTVDREVNPRYYDLIETFEGLTGVPAVLNTSYNLAGSPIDRSPEQAIDTFLRCGMDELCIGDFVVGK